MKRYILAQAGKYDGTYHADAHLEPFSGGSWVKAADVKPELEEAVNVIRHLKQKNHLFSPLGCSGCDNAIKLLTRLEGG